MTSDSLYLFYTVLTPKSAPLSGLSFPCFSWIILLLISKRSWIDGFFSFPGIAFFCATGFLSAFPASLTAVFASTPALGTASLLSFFSATCYHIVRTKRQILCNCFSVFSGRNCCYQCILRIDQLSVSIFIFLIIRCIPSTLSITPVI